MEIKRLGAQIFVQAWMKKRHNWNSITTLKLQYILSYDRVFDEGQDVFLNLQLRNQWTVEYIKTFLMNEKSNDNIIFPDL